MSQDNLRKLLNDLEDALSAGTDSEATKIIASIEQEDISLPMLLDEFETAIENENYQNAEVVLRKIGHEYEKLSIGETAAVKRSIEARNQSGVTGQHRTILSEHSHQAIGTELTRAMFLATAAVFVATPDAANKQEVQDTIKKLKQSEKNFRKNSKRAKMVTKTVELSPSVAILSAPVTESPLKKGVSAPLSVVVGNVGDKPAKGIRLSASGANEVTIDPSVEPIGRLDAHVDSTQEFEITGNQPGDYSITFKLSSENGGSSLEETTFEVVDKERAQSDQPGVADNTPDWLPFAGGAGALGLGAAGAYKYINIEGSDQNNERQD